MIRKRKYYITAVIIAAILLGILINAHSVNTVSLSVVGDILLDRGVGEKIRSSGVYYPYEEIKDATKKADIMLGNLECPLTSTGTPILKKSNLIFKGDIANLPALKQAGFDILNLANNHALDYGREGLDNTIQALQAAGIKALGAGTDREEAHKPIFIEKDGINLGFMSFSAFPPEGYFYFEDRSDIAHVDEKLIGTEIKNAKENCDLLFVSFHWGKEFDFIASEDQKKLAHLAIDSGADVIIGHHPHVLQGIEEYKGKLIFYSMGNFVFDGQIWEGTDETAIVNLKLLKSGIKEVEIIPLKIIDCQPRKVDNIQTAEILNKLKLYSQGMNSDIVIKKGRALITTAN